MGRFAHYILLILNAAGRSIQVYDGKIISVIFAVACFFSALAGTLGKQDNHAENSRNTASKISKDSLIECGYKTCESTDQVQNPIGRDNSFSILFFLPNNPISETEPTPTTSAIRHSI